MAIGLRICSVAVNLTSRFYPVEFKNKLERYPVALQASGSPHRQTSAKFR